MIPLVIALALFLAAPVADAQQPAKVPRIGVLHSHPRDHPLLDAFRRGLRELGYVEGQSIAIEWRLEKGNADRIAAELVGLKVDLIVAGGTGLAQAAQRATKTIPVVFPLSDQPVALGLVASLARPGGNLTGLTTLNAELSAKRLELLKEALPRLTRVAVLGATDRLAPLVLKEATVAARTLGVQLHYLETRSPDDLDGRFAEMTKERAGALLVLPGRTALHRPRIAALSLKHRLPAIANVREFTAAGGLMAYGCNQTDMFYRAASFVERIVKGAKPSELPVEQPTKLELFVNLKTARALALTIPPLLLLRADQVFQ